SKTKLIDSFKYGEYQVKVFDEKTSDLLYSRGFSSLFGEWQTTVESKQMSRSFNETVLIPFPKETVILTLLSRNHDGVSEEKFRLRIDPASYFIRPAKPSTASVFKVQINAPSENAVDIVILGDGYTAAEMGNFIADCEHFGEMMFGFEPFKTWQKAFNIRAVMVASAESGSRIPGDKVYPSTALSSSYYTFDSERYCMTYDHKTLRDFAGLTPYDQIYILVNSEKYGGGGIYNFYSLSASKNKLSGEIIVHEFGHGFAGLGDEYFDSSTSYNDFYNPMVEPWEPNLTTMVDFESKWKQFLSDSVPVPTPSTKKYNEAIGVFEGGGYVAKGVFRPRQDCLMHTFKGHTFCAVCEDAIIKMIRFYTE
ncbi:MAG: M64 family metallopeptidase, partial [Bacteroidales bacterium]